jgi:hypothetical protein
MAGDHGGEFVQRDLRMIGVDRVVPGQDRSDRGVITQGGCRRTSAAPLPAAPPPSVRSPPAAGCPPVRHRLHVHPVAGSPDHPRQVPHARRMPVRGHHDDAQPCRVAQQRLGEPDVADGVPRPGLGRDAARGTPAAAAISAMAVASARGGAGSYMPYAPDITIRCARPERYNAAARTARATVAGCGSPPAVMPPPRATMTPARAAGTGPMLLRDIPRRNPGSPRHA